MSRLRPTSTPLQRLHDRRRRPREREDRSQRSNGRPSNDSSNERAQDEYHNFEKGLVKISWRVYRSTPLFGLDDSASKLRFYGRHLGCSIEANIRKGEAILTGEETANRAVFKIHRGFHHITSDERVVEILLKKKIALDRPAVTVLTAILCGSKPSCRQAGCKLPEDVTLLPVMLVKGSVSLTRFLIHWLQNQFDCSIHPVVFSSMDLEYALALCDGVCLSADHLQPIQLVFEPPREIIGLNKITCTFSSDQFHQLCTSICPEGDQSLLSENDVKKVFNVLVSHIRRTVGTNMDEMQLTRVGSSVLLLGRNGIVKVFQKDFLLQVVAFLTEICQEQSMFYTYDYYHAADT